MRIKSWTSPFHYLISGGEWEAKIKEISKGIVEFILTKQLRDKKITKKISG